MQEEEISSINGLQHDNPVEFSIMKHVHLLQVPVLRCLVGICSYFRVYFGVLSLIQT